MDLNRRRFLKGGARALSMLGITGGLLPLNRINAFAQGTSGYRALVCIFLNGGNDANNTIVPLASDAYAAYAEGRGGLAVAQAIYGRSPRPTETPMACTRTSSAFSGSSPIAALLSWQTSACWRSPSHAPNTLPGPVHFRRTSFLTRISSASGRPAWRLRASGLAGRDGWPTASRRRICPTGFRSL